MKLNERDLSDDSNESDDSDRYRRVNRPNSRRDRRNDFDSNARLRRDDESTGHVDPRQRISRAYSPDYESPDESYVKKKAANLPDGSSLNRNRDEEMEYRRNRNYDDDFEDSSKRPQPKRQTSNAWSDQPRKQDERNETAWSAARPPLPSGPRSNSENTSTVNKSSAKNRHYQETYDFEGEEDSKQSSLHQHRSREDMHKRSDSEVLFAKIIPRKGSRDELAISTRGNQQHETEETEEDDHVEKQLSGKYKDKDKKTINKSKGPSPADFLHANSMKTAAASSRRSSLDEEEEVDEGGGADLGYVDDMEPDALEVGLQQQPQHTGFSRSPGGMTGESSVIIGPSFVQIAHESGITTEHVQCLIVRDRSTMSSKLYPSYNLYHEEKDKLLIRACKMNLNRTSNYHLFDMTRGLAGSKLSKKSGNYLGKLRAKNVQRTEYVLITHASEREEIAAVVFDQHGLITQIKDGSLPRKMSVMVPQLDADSIPVPNRTNESGAGSMVDMLIQNDHGNMFVFESKSPVFENGNYRLNFHGRVTIPSVKNFQLVSNDDKNHVICQFGKIGEDRFHLDYKAPLNAFQAFALALCQFNL